MNFSFWLTFFFGLLVGGCLGLVLAALLGAAHQPRNPKPKTQNRN